MAALSYQEISKLLTAIRDERRTHANTATRVGDAMMALLSYFDTAPYLRKDKADTTNFLLTLLAGAVVGESGQIRLNPDGSISCSQLTVDGSAIFKELVFNRQNVLEGDTFFSDKGIIDKVLFLSNRQFRLYLRKEYDNDIVTFHAYDVIKCSINNLDTGKTYRTSWMRVNSVDTDGNSIDVSIYDNGDVPGGTNYSPVAGAKLVRWGNQVDADRQQVWFISSEDGRFLFLQGVTQPILTDGNYSAFFGVPPQLDLLDGLPLNARQPYLFARGLIVQDIIKIDYNGNPEYTARDCGIWQADRQYIHGYDETAKGYFSDRVWWGGCLWQAALPLPTIGNEPRYNNADWVCLLGGKNFSMDIVSTEGDSFPAGAPWQTTLVVSLWNAEMQISESEIGRNNITWQRVSTDSDADNAWNIQHGTGTVGLSLSLDSTVDFPGAWQRGSQVSFICTVTLPETNDSYSTSYSILM